MKFANHFKMGRFIHRTMDENGMPLAEIPYLLGGLAPDLFLTFLWRSHSRASSSAHFEKLLGRLRRSARRPSRFFFPFYLGVTTHYICDFLCYAHSSAFHGPIQEHIRYEHEQTVSEGDILPFRWRQSLARTLDEMTEKLDGYFESHDRLLAENPAMHYTDVPVAMYASTWAVSCVYHCAKQTVRDDSPDAAFRLEVRF